jgi:cell fate regulator YaaT (PSP1 superfamily)
MDIRDVDGFNLVEVSFKNGARKGFYINDPSTRASTGDFVAVESNSGYDVGRITLSGELVRLQLKRKRVRAESVNQAVIRKANERDIERMQEARSLENPTMVRARAISRSLNLDMKVGDVEFQADQRKATFYYTSDGRVDFRELIRLFAKEFRVKIEMRQIGARQESARIGGLGACGRELCCSTWLTDFKSVSTSAARYQNMAINQAKLSGQCGRLKCCLNYELDTYMDALERFPDRVERLRTGAGTAVLMKTDIFKGIMYYFVETDQGRSKVYALLAEQVREIKEMNKRGEMPPDLVSLQMEEEVSVVEEHDYESVNEVIDLPMEERKRRRKKRKPQSGANAAANAQSPQTNRPQRPKQTTREPAQEKPKDTPQNTASNDSNQAEGANKRRSRNKRRGGKPRPRNPEDK